MIELDKASVKYGQALALEEISVRIDAHEIVAIVDAADAELARPQRCRQDHPAQGADGPDAIGGRSAPAW